MDRREVDHPSVPAGVHPGQAGADDPERGFEHHPEEVGEPLGRELLDGGDYGLIVVRDSNREPGDDFAVLTTVDSPRTPGVLAAALRRVPRSLFVNEYTSQPDEIMNCKPSLLPQIAIRAWYYGDRRDEESRAQFARAYSEVGR